MKRYQGEVRAFSKDELIPLHNLYMGLPKEDPDKLAASAIEGQEMEAKIVEIVRLIPENGKI